MATEKWVEIGSKYCKFIEKDITLRERRVYPGDALPDTEPYRSLSSACSAAIECNLADVPCKWAFTNPASDQYMPD